MKTKRGLSYALVTAAAVALGLLILRLAVSPAPSLTFEFLSNRFTYLYVFAATATVFVTLGYVLGRKIDRFRYLSTVDALTGLPNRRALEMRLREEWGRSRRYGSPLSMLLIDIDGLKRVNDERGHAAGDQILRGASKGIRSSLRAVDFGGRWGGDEFAVLAPNTPKDAAQALAQRLLDRMARRAGGTDLPAPASIGVATFDPGRDPSATPDWLMRQADTALYQAKSSGRQQVRVA